MRKSYKVTNPKAGSKSYDLVGNKFGLLQVIEFVKLDKNKNKMWLCMCECGNTCHVTTTYLTSGKTTSCKCNRYKKGEDVYNFNGYKEITGTKWNSIQNNAKNRSLDFLITKEFIWTLLTNQNNKCYFTGLDIDYVSGTASIDRIDNNLGYTEDNVIMVHKDINLMRNKFSVEYFINLCKLVSQKQII